VRLGTVQADPLRAIELAGSIEDRQEGRELLTTAVLQAAKIGPGAQRSANHV
jgi:type III secretory pathway component EscT